MIFMTTVLFPLVAIAAGVAVIGALLKFVRDIQRDMRRPQG